MTFSLSIPIRTLLLSPLAPPTELQAPSPMPRPCQLGSPHPLPLTLRSLLSPVSQSWPCVLATLKSWADSGPSLTLSSSRPGAFLGRPGCQDVGWLGPLGRRCWRVTKCMLWGPLSWYQTRIISLMSLVLKMLKPVQLSVQLRGVLLGCFGAAFRRGLILHELPPATSITNEDRVGGVEGGTNGGEWVSLSCPFCREGHRVTNTGSWQPRLFEQV